MAKVHNISLKSVKSFRGHEWEECYQGNIYLGTKKIGTWSQDSWGGPDMIHLDDKYDESKFVEKCKELTNYGEYATMEMLFFDIVELLDIEKYFKKKVNEGQVLFVASDCGMRAMWVINLKRTPSDDIISTFMKNPTIKKEIDKMNKETMRVAIYTSIKDFDYGTHIEEKDILREVA